MRYASLFVSAVVSIATSVPALGEGILYVANFNGDNVSTYSTSGQLLNANFISGLNRPHDICISGPYLFVLEWGSGSVGQYLLDGTVINRNLITGVPEAISFQVSGSDLYLVRNVARTVSKYTLGSTPGTIASSSIIISSGLSNPAGLVILNDHLYITNQNNGKIGKYTLSGAAINPAVLDLDPGPTDIVASSDTLYFNNQFDREIGVYNINTAGYSTFPVIEISNAYPWSVSLFESKLYVSNGDGTIGVYSTSGSVINPTLISGLNAPTGLLVVENVPEPASLAIVGVALALGFMRRR